jgi:outer membrane protein assembly factor BamB
MTKFFSNSAALRLARRFAWFAIIVIASAAAGGAAQKKAAPADSDWTQFGYDVSGSGASTAPTGITAANVASLTRKQVPLDGIVDASAIYLHGVTVKGAAHDTLFLTTTYGKTIAIDANQGTVLWEFTPAKYDSWAGSRQITNTTPVADPDRQNIYAAAPDGTVNKLAIADGTVVWSTPITQLPAREKMDSPLKLYRGHIIAVTGGYIGDRPPYQGHVAILDARTGALLHVWNSLCSDRAGLIDPNSCTGQRSAIWGRAGAVIDPETGNIFVATGNGTYDGKTNWGDATIELNPDATQMLGNYTPEDNAELDQRDLDIGSTSPVLLGGDIIAQGGKDGLIRLISIKSMSGTSPHAGGELQTVPTPGSQRLLTAVAVWRHDGQVSIYSADGGGTSAWNYTGGKLVDLWTNSTSGTSPLIAGGLLFVYSPQGGLHVYDPVKGTQIANLDCGAGHWNTPIVVDGKIILPEGNANQPGSAGVLDIWSAPTSH